jgi:hypothetical protein
MYYHPEFTDEEIWAQKLALSHKAPEFQPLQSNTNFKYSCFYSSKYYAPTGTLCLWLPQLRSVPTLGSFNTLEHAVSTGLSIVQNCHDQLKELSPIPYKLGFSLCAPVLYHLVFRRLDLWFPCSCRLGIYFWNNLFQVTCMYAVLKELYKLSSGLPVISKTA